jgi:hypothetical protein
MENHYKFIIIALIFLAGTMFLWLRRGKKVKMVDVIGHHYPGDDGPTPLVKVDFKNDPAKSGEEDFLGYMQKYAEKQKLEKNSEKETLGFFIDHFDSLRLSYVFETGKPLMLNNVSETINKASMNYLKS